MATTTLLATVTLVSGMAVSVVMPDGSTAVLQRDRHVTCAVGDLVRIGRDGGAQWVEAALGPGAAPAPEPAVDTDDTTAGTSTSATPTTPAKISSDRVSVRPVSAGTWRNGRWLDTTDLTQGDWGWGVGQGAAYYGNGFTSLPGVLRWVNVKLRRAGGGVFGAQTPTMCLLAGRTRPAGAPTVLATAAGPALAVGDATDWATPASWPARLKSGEAGGIGIYVAGRTPYIKLSSSGDGMTVTTAWEEIT